MGANERERLNQDLGLGGKMADRSRKRLVNQDGTFNVRRTHRGPLHPINLYHTLVHLSVGRLIAVMAAGYLVVNGLFAGAYYLCGRGAIDGTAPEGWRRFEDCFFFSVQTLATIGYGRMVPVSRVANLAVAIEALIGLLGFAVLSALLFTRFARPTARIEFSSHALIAPYKGGQALMMRMVNLRRHDLTEVRATVAYARWTTADGERRRQFDALALERENVMFLPLHWVIVHPIDERSPMWGLTEQEFAAGEPEIIVLLTADDETFAQTVHARTSYRAAEVAWNARFADMYVPDEQYVRVDLSRLSDFERL
jgi:inward rectifier potassium channel